MNCIKCRLPVYGDICECGFNQAMYQKMVHNSDKYYNLAKDSHKNKNLSDAIAYLKNSIKFNSENVDAHNLLGICYGEMGQYGDASYHFLLSCFVDENNEVATKYLDEIKKYLDRNEHIELTYIMYNRALEKAQTGNIEKAILELNEAVKANEKFVKAMNLLALLHYKNGSNFNAKKMYKKVLKIDRSNELALKLQNQVENIVFNTTSIDTIDIQKEIAKFPANSKLMKDDAKEQTIVENNQDLEIKYINTKPIENIKKDNYQNDLSEVNESINSDKKNKKNKKNKKQQKQENKQKQLDKEKQAIENQITTKIQIVEKQESKFPTFISGMLLMFVISSVVVVFLIIYPNGKKYKDLNVKYGNLVIDNDNLQSQISNLNKTIDEYEEQFINIIKERNVVLINASYIFNESGRVVDAANTLYKVDEEYIDDYDAEGYKAFKNDIYTRAYDKLYQNGIKSFESNNYEQSRLSFETAYVYANELTYESGVADTLYWLGRSYEAEENTEDALRCYNLFEKNYYKDSRRDDVVQRIASLSNTEENEIQEEPYNNEVKE